MSSRKTTTSKHAQNKNSNVKSMLLQLYYIKESVDLQIEETNVQRRSQQYNYKQNNRGKQELRKRKKRGNPRQ